MVRKIAVTFLLFLSVFSFSQCNDCFKNYGGWVNDNIRDLDVDNNGNFYVTHSGGIEKFGPNCESKWIKNFNISAGNIVGITVDSNENVYLLFDYRLSENASNYGPFTNNGITYYRGLNLIKFDLSGNFIWNRRVADKNSYMMQNIFNINNNIYITSTSHSSTTINNQLLFDFPYTDYPKAFIAKYDLNGTFLNANFYGDGLISFYDSEIDNLGNIYLSKTTSGTSFSLGSSSLLKIDNNLNLIWTKELSNTSNNNSVFLPTQLYFNSFNNKLYIWGSFNTTVNVLGNIFSISGGNAISQSLLCELETNSGNLSQIKRFDNNSTRVLSGGNSISTAYLTNKLNNLYIFSSFKNTMAFQNQTINSGSYIDSGTTYYAEDLVLFKVDTNNFNDEFIFKSINQTPYINGYSHDYSGPIIFNNDNLIVTSTFTSKPIEINGTLINNNSGNQNSDAFYYRFNINGINSNSINLNSCLNSNINLSAPNGSNYVWTGPNGFTSNIQNPSIPNANTTHSGQYTCNLIDTNGCNKTQTINVFVGDNTKPLPTTSILSTITGDCNTVIAVPTATDNCSGLINATTTDQLTNLLPGTYTIHWNYNDGNGNIETQNQTVIIGIVSLPTITSPQTFCIQQNATLNSIAITGQNIKWYDAPINGNLLPNTTILANGVTYYASQTINSCESNRVPIVIQIQNTPAPTGNANQSFCSTANVTVADIITNGTNVIWYDSASNTTSLTNSTLLTNNTTYYATQTINGCESTNRLAVTISLINTLNATNYSEIICDDLNDNVEIKNLTNYNSNLISSTGNIFSYYDTYNNALSQNSAGQINNFANYNLTIGTTIFYVRIDSPNTCFQIVTLTLELVSKPIIPVKNIEPLCEGKNITLNAGNNYDTYTWSTGETTQTITITQSGNYSVIVTKNHGTTTCTSTKNFTVVNSNIATIQEIISSDWTENNNTITVLLNNNSQGDYEYSLNGIDFQDSNIFNNLEAGEYTVFIRDKNGCGMVSEELYLLMYPKFFTPNGDGYNDYWKIKFSENEPNLTVKIFDRYGKLLKHLGTNSIGWDGKYLSKDVPSSDYWFVVTRENGKEYKGHFSLKR